MIAGQVARTLPYTCARVPHPCVPIPPDANPTGPENHPTAQDDEFMIHLLKALEPVFVKTR